MLESALAAYGVALGHASLIAIDDRVSAAELLRHVWDSLRVKVWRLCTVPHRLGPGRSTRRAGRCR